MRPSIDFPHHQLVILSAIAIGITIAIVALPAHGYINEFATSLHHPSHMSLLMPDVQPLEKETYLCTAFKMPKHDHKYIVGFEPNATKHIAHHIIIYGCETPGWYERDSPRGVWDCGEMSHVGHGSGYRPAPSCGKGSQILYAWAMDAPPLELPKGVGFKVGAGTGVDFLVLQVHYANVDSFINGGYDRSGIILKTLPGNTDLVDKRAGVILYGTGGSIPPRSIEHMESACTQSEPLELHPFAFRTHTHKLGTLVAGYRIRPDGEWTLIGKHNPQEPQMFYPTAEKDLIVQQNDVVAARCTMRNTLEHEVNIGSTGNDEMCNFYMMYWVHGDEILEKKYCFTSGPPFYYWKNDPQISEIPAEIDKSASQA